MSEQKSTAFEFLSSEYEGNISSLINDDDEILRLNNDNDDNSDVNNDKNLYFGSTVKLRQCLINKVSNGSELYNYLLLENKNKDQKEKNLKNKTKNNDLLNEKKYSLKKIKLY